MSTKFEQETLAGLPYFDDFEDAKNFLRIVFNPARAVQARELTQVQTILHNQISKFGNHFFKEGTNVLGGELKLRRRATVTINAEDLQILGGGSATYLDFENRYIQGQTSGAKGQIVLIENNISETPVKHRFHLAMRGGEFINGEQIRTVNGPYEQYVTTYETVNTATEITFGTSLVANLYKGIFYIGGSFVTTPDQEVVVNGASDTGTFKIGILSNEEVVSYIDDTTLLDPANGSINSNAPGGDRYKSSIELVAYTQTATEPDNYFNLMNIDGIAVLKYNKGTEYSEILKILARRTSDESGNYTVNSPTCKVEEQDPNNINYKISPLKAYVDGFGLETISSTKVSAVKPRTPKRIEIEYKGLKYGTFVDVKNDATGNPIIQDFFEVDNHPVVYLWSEEGATGVVVGQARLLYQIKAGSKQRIYLGDSNSIRKDLKVTKSIGNLNTQGTNGQSTIYYNLETFNENQQTNTYCPIMSTNNSPVRHVYKTAYTAQDIYKSQIDVAGLITIEAPTFNIDFMENSAVLIKETDTGNIVTFGATVLHNMSNAAKSYFTIADVTGTGPYDVLVRYKNNSGTHKVKTLSKITTTFDATQTSKQLSHYDVDRVLSIYNITDDISKTQNLLNAPVLLDNGARDYYYDFGILNNLVSGKTYEVTYMYYAHSGASGAYFCADSYQDPNGYYSSDNGNYVLGDGSVTNTMYSMIPVYRDTRRIQTYSLRSCLDFRRNITDFEGGSALIEPVTQSVIDYDFYLSRIDRIWIDSSGAIGVTSGIEEVDPIPAPIAEDSLVLFEVRLSPYMFVLSDVQIKKEKAQRYTMRDIGELERRINDIEYYTSFNLLQNKADSLDILDANGLPRSKNGMFVDNFTSHNNGKVSDPDYRCSIDKISGILKCPFQMDYFEVKHNPAGDNLNIKVHPNIITLDYTPVKFLEVVQASDIVNLNPYEVFVWEGSVILTPGSDNFIDLKRVPERTLDFSGMNDSINVLTNALNIIGNTTVSASETFTTANINTNTSISNILGQNISQVISEPVISTTSEIFGTPVVHDPIDYVGHDADGNLVNQDKMIMTQAERLAYQQANNPDWDSQSQASKDWILAHMGETQQTTDTTTRATTTSTVNTSSQADAWSDVSVAAETDVNIDTTRNITTYTTTSNLAVARGTTTQQMGDRVVDTSISPYIRAQTIEIFGKGFKPNTVLRAWFDDVEVTQFCAGLTTGSLGDLSGTFTIPAGVFNAGDIILYLKDKVDHPTTIGTSTFSSFGLVQTKEQSVISMDTPSVTGNASFETSFDTKTTSELFRNSAYDSDYQSTTSYATGSSTSSTYNDNTTSVTKALCPYDPVAQSFYVQQPGGVFLESIDIYFESKDYVTPATLYLVPMDDGYPKYRRIPYSTVSVDAMRVAATRYDVEQGKFFYNGVYIDGNNVEHSANSEVVGATDFVATNFKFSDPVYLKDGTDYSFVVVSNSTNYNIHISHMSKPHSITGAIIDKQPTLGSMFISQNASTWTAEQYKDVKFTMNKCEFNSSTGDLFLKPTPLSDLWQSNKTYFTDETVVYKTTVNVEPFIGYYLCKNNNVTSIPSTSGSTSDWHFLSKASSEMTHLNFNIDSIKLPGTDLVSTYKLTNDPIYQEFKPKNDIKLWSRNTVELSTESTDTIDIHSVLTTSNKNHSPIIHRHRSGVVTMNNNTIFIDVKNYDAGTFISKTTRILKKAQNLVIMLDENAYNGAYTKVWYQTTLHYRNYLTLSDSSPVHKKFKDNMLYSYRFNDDLTVSGIVPENVTGWQYRSKLICDGIDETLDNNGRLYASSIENYDDYVVAGDFASEIPAMTDIILTTEPDIAISEIFKYNAAVVGGYVVNSYILYNGDLWQNLADGNGTTPTAGGIDWRHVGCVYPVSTVQESESSWEPTEVLPITVGNMNRQYNYIERVFLPTITPTEAFDTFTVKIEMFSVDEVNTPNIRNLRVIATS